MSYQKKILFVVFLIIIGMTYAIMFFVSKEEEKGINKLTYKKVIAEGISLKIPALSTPQDTTTYMEGGWLIRKYRWQRIGVFRISTAGGRAPNFQILVKRYFNIEKIPESEKLLIGKKLMYLKLIPLFKNGIYAIEKKGKGLKYIYFFTLKNVIYWIDFLTESTMEMYKKIFDNILTSIESSDKSIHRKLSKKEFLSQLNLLCLKSYFLLCQSVKGILIITALFSILILLFINLIMSLGGKLPEDDFFKGEHPLFKEEGVSYQIKFGISNKVTVGAFAITDKNIYIFSFKKPQLIFPKNSTDIKISTGKSFFSGRFILIETENSEYFVKRSSLLLKSFSRTKYSIKIFLNEIDSAYAYLGIKSSNVH